MKTWITTKVDLGFFMLINAFLLLCKYTYLGIVRRVVERDILLWSWIRSQSYTYRFSFLCTHIMLACTVKEIVKYYQWNRRNNTWCSIGKNTLSVPRGFTDVSLARIILYLVQSFTCNVRAYIRRFVFIYIDFYRKW